MKTIRKYGQRKIWFGRWTNKSWAVFSSLKVVVHILHLKKTVCCQALLKQAGMARLLLMNSFFLKEVLPALNDPDNEPPSMEELFNLLFKTSTIQLTGEAAGNRLPFLRNRYIPCRTIISGSAGDFYFYLNTYETENYQGLQVYS